MEPTTLDLLPAFDELVSLLQGLTGMQEVFEGVPETLERGVNAYIAATAQAPVTAAAFNYIENVSTFFVGLTYAVRRDEAGAERQLVGMLPELVRALVQARSSNLNGTVQSLSWDFSIANDPAYTVSANREYRVFPLLIRVKLAETIT